MQDILFEMSDGCQTILATLKRLLAYVLPCRRPPHDHLDIFSTCFLLPATCSVQHIRQLPARRITLDIVARLSPSHVAQKLIIRAIWCLAELYFL